MLYAPTMGGHTYDKCQYIYIYNFLQPYIKKRKVYKVPFSYDKSSYYNRVINDLASDN